MGRFHLVKRCLWTTTITTLFHPLAIPEAHAFQGPYHEEVTKKATAYFEFGSETAKAVITGNLNADAKPSEPLIGEGEWFKPEAHFDNETFSDGSARIRAKFDSAVANIVAGNKDLAIEDIGRALHAIQDFMSHSNFVVNSPNDAIDLFNLTDPTSADRAKGVDCNTGKGPLSTGYWYYTDLEIAQTLAKKVTRPSNRCMHDKLHKDKPDCPAGAALHEVAKKRAVDFSIDFIQRIKTKLDKLHPGKGLFDVLVKDGDRCKAVFLAHPELALKKKLVPRPAINWGNGKAFFFNGDKYTRYDIAKGAPDPGYPKSIDAQTWPGLWTSGIDAALKWSSDTAYFFKGNQYIRYRIKPDVVIDKSHPFPGFPKTIDEKSWPGLWGASGIDASVEWGPSGGALGILTNKAYIFNGNEYVRYSVLTGKAETTHKVVTAQSWNGLCANGIDGAVNWGNGKVYLFKGNYYFRFDVKKDKVDPGYPQPVNSSTWPGL